MTEQSPFERDQDPGTPAGSPYGQPAPADAPAPSQGSDGLSITALVLGIISLCAMCAGIFALPFSIAAVVCGFIARKRSAENNRPTGMATAGLVMGIISGVLALAWTALVYVGLIGSSGSSVYYG